MSDTYYLIHNITTDDPKNRLVFRLYLSLESAAVDCRRDFTRFQLCYYIINNNNNN